MTENAHNLQVGEPVVVKAGTGDPDLEIDVSGWHGRITEIIEEGGQTVVSVQWDSITLTQDAPEGMIVECEENGMDWSEMFLLAGDVEPANPRDTEEDVQQTIAQLEEEYAWTYLGDQGDRIRNVLAGTDFDDEQAMFERWRRHLDKRLNLPFTAAIFELQPDEVPYRRGDSVHVKGVNGVDERDGVLARAVFKHKPYDIPLKDLAATNQQSHNYRLIDDYSIWYANRDRYTVRE